MIVLTPLNTANPLSCLVLSNTSLTVPTCVNLNTPNVATPITINQTWVNTINPNIKANLAVVLQFSSQLQAKTEYSIQIITDNVLPAIG